MFDTAGRNAAARLKRASQHAVFKFVDTGAVGCRVTIFGRELPVTTILPIERKLEEIDNPVILPSPIETDTVALGRITRLEIENAGCTCDGQNCTARKHIGADLTVEMIDGQADAVVGIG